MAFDTITINNAKVTDKGVELKTSKQGKQYAQLTVMWSSTRKSQDGSTEYGPTKFINVFVRGYEAENVAAHVHAGDRVNVTGTVQHFEWQSNNGPKDDWSITGSVSLPVPRAQQQGCSWSQQPAQAPQAGNWGQAAPTGQQGMQQAQANVNTVMNEQPPF